MFWKNLSSSSRCSTLYTERCCRCRPLSMLGGSEESGRRGKWGRRGLTDSPQATPPGPGPRLQVRMGVGAEAKVGAALWVQPGIQTSRLDPPPSCPCPSPVYTSVSTSSKWEQEQRSQPAKAGADPGSARLEPGGSRLTHFTTLYSLQGATHTCRRPRVPGPILITLLQHILPAPKSLGPPRQGVLFCTPKSPLAQPRPSASSPFLPRWVQTHPPKTWVLASWMLLSLLSLRL